MRLLAGSAMVIAAATVNFLLFWGWFEFWRRHRMLTYTMMIGDLALLGVAIHRFSAYAFAWRLGMPLWIQVMGWLLVAIASVFAFVADRQIGLRVRSFTPFFEATGKIQLETSLAYGVVRHPIYASGIGYQLGTFLITGYPLILVACLIFTLGALWFTRQEERRLRSLLDDPSEYDRYRARVPALFPFTKRSHDVPK